ncbi:MAG TPA: hypothetical protein VN618_15145 [Solirubrobacteraceae bacterium]|nr:hypothetical protein [Solirubrobacteraceae bacterium]
MSTAEHTEEARPQLPEQPSERRAWAVAATLAAVGVAVLAAVLSGAVGRTSELAPPPVNVRFATPQAGAGASSDALAPLTAQEASGRGSAIVGHPSVAEQRAARRRLAGAPVTHIPRRWIEGFYPIYATAERTFGVNWLLIASIHMQESAFSTAPGIYHGLNFARCCGGPMQFNVTNGTVTTWDLVSDSYRYGRRPAGYDHMTARHPSIYDDFDSIMAGAHLLSADGAGYALDGTAWVAAYDYYGHDETGVQYADRVLARAIGWSQRGFCINCGVEPRLVQAVHAAYGAPVLAQLQGSVAAVARAAARPRGGSGKKPKRRRLRADEGPVLG